jgi:hypothetical protein
VRYLDASVIEELIHSHQARRTTCCAKRYGQPQAPLRMTPGWVVVEHPQEFGTPAGLERSPRFLGESDRIPKPRAYLDHHLRHLGTTGMGRPNTHGAD